MMRMPGCLSLVVLTSCLSSHDFEMPATSKTEVLGAYQVLGNNLILSGPPKIIRYCIGSSLGEDIQTGSDTIEFNRRGDSLTVFLDKQFTDAGSEVQNTRLFLLLFRGTGGLMGIWRFVEPGYRVISGIPTAAESTALNQGLEWTRRELAFKVITWEVTASSIILKEDIQTACLFVAKWNGEIGGGANYADSSVFDISVQTISKTTVEMAGRRTSEVVWLSDWPNGDRTYRSGEASHAEFRYFSSPQGCPAPIEPSWYADFLAGNRKIVNIPPL